MIVNSPLRRFRMSAIAGLAFAAAISGTAVAQTASGSISGGGDDAQSNSIGAPAAGTVVPGTMGTDNTTTNSMNVDSISGQGDDAQSNSIGAPAAGTMTTTPAASAAACDPTQTAGATECNQQSGDDAESASGLPVQSN